MTTRIFFFLFGLFVFVACGSDKTPVSTSGTSAETTAAAVASKPDTWIYAVKVDNLMLRDQPTQNGSKASARLPEGSFVKGTHELSANKEKADIRGMTMEEPFVKVTTTDAAAQTGWAFAGGLTCLYAGDANGSPDLSKLRAFSSFLKTCDPRKLESGKAVWDYLKKEFPQTTGATLDAVFVLTDDFLTRVESVGELYTLTENYNWSEADFEAVYAGAFDMNKYPLTQKIAVNGFKLSTGEGIIWPTPDWQQLQVFFTPRVTPAMKTYIDQVALEDQTVTFEDGAIVAPLASIAERAVFWEKFNQKYPYFILSERTQESQRWMHSVILNGTDNTPMYDYESGQISDDFIKLWNAVQQQYPGTQLAAYCKQMADLCASEGWKHNEKVESFRNKWNEEHQ